MNFFTRKILFAVLLMVIVASGIYYYTNLTPTGTAKTTAIAKKMNIVQEVLVSGNIKPQTMVDLAFEKNGKVKTAPVDIGATVKAHDVLATLESDVERSNVLDAEARVAVAKASLQELLHGTRIEDINIKETELAKAKSDLDSIYMNVPNVLSDSFNKADNAINKQINQLFSDEASSNPTLLFSTRDQQSKLNAESGRLQAGATLAKLEIISQSLPKTNPEADQNLLLAKEYLNAIHSFLLKISAALNNTLNVTDANLSLYKENVNSGRSNLTLAIGNINEKIQVIGAQKLIIERTNQELERSQAGATNESIDGARAQVLQVTATLESARATLQKMTLESPIDGLVTRQDAKVGQIVTANVPIISIINPSQFKIESNVPEADVAKISIGDKTSITLDSYGPDVIFTAKVFSIDPAEKVIDGVPTYKVTFIFDTEDSRVKSGMTANITITTAERNGVLTVPQRALADKNGKKIVQVLTQQNPDIITEKEVVTGIKGSSGDIEILNGLKLNEIIIIPTKKN